MADDGFFANKLALLATVRVLGVAAALALASAQAAAQGPGSPGFSYAGPPQPNPYSPQGMAQGLLFQLKAVRDNYETNRQGCIRELQQSAVDFNQFHCTGGGYALDAVTGLPKTDPKDDAFVEIGQCVYAVNGATGIMQQRAGVVEQDCRNAQARAQQKPNYGLANACWPQLHQAATTADRAFFDYRQSAQAGNRDRAQAAAELRQASDCIKQEVIGNATFDSYMAFMAKGMAGNFGAWIRALNPQQLQQFIDAALQAGIPQKLIAQLQSGGGYPVPPYPTPGPYNPPPPQPPYAVPYDPSQVYPPLQQVSEFSNRMRAAAESILQSVGRISKAMTDANDVTKHNNVGIGVAFGSMFGAASQMMRLTASQYQALAVAGHATGDEAAVVQIANVAASESQTFAGQAMETVSELGAAGPEFSQAQYGAAASGYTENAVFDPLYKPLISQNVEIPNCTAHACAKLADLLGRNDGIFKIFAQESLWPKITLEVTREIQNGQVVEKVSLAGGLNAQEVASALQSIGIQAQVGTGLPGLLSEVNAGRPLIAGVYTIQPPPIAAAGQASSAVKISLHALVIEGAEVRGGILGLKIYDPLGSYYWQPISTFAKYFTGEFVKAL